MLTSAGITVFSLLLSRSWRRIRTAWSEFPYPYRPSVCCMLSECIARNARSFHKLCMQGYSTSEASDETVRCLMEQCCSSSTGSLRIGPSLTFRQIDENLGLVPMFSYTPLQSIKATEHLVCPACHNQDRPGVPLGISKSAPSVALLYTDLRSSVPIPPCRSLSSSPRPPPRAPTVPRP